MFALTRTLSPRQQPAGRMRLGMNLWPPLLFAGIHVQHLAPDWHEARVVLRMHRWNRNLVGTQFGGSLFAMTDPFWMMLLMHRLGGDYIVWDSAAEITFVSPGRGDVFAHFELPDDRVERIRAAADAGHKHREWFSADVTTAGGQVVARTRKQVYVRRKPGR